MNQFLSALRERVAGWIRKLSAAPSRREVDRATTSLHDPARRRPEADEAARKAITRIEREASGDSPPE